MYAAAAWFRRERRNSRRSAQNRHSIPTPRRWRGSSRNPRVQPAGNRTRQNAGDQEHHEQRRQDTQDPALVEIGERERSFADVRVDHAADQISGNDEEDIDADKAAGKAGDAHVIEQHGNDGDRAQAVDVGAVPRHLGPYLPRKDGPQEAVAVVGPHRRKRIQAGQVGCIKTNRRCAARFLRKGFSSKIGHLKSNRRRGRRCQRPALQYPVHHRHTTERRLRHGYRGAAAQSACRKCGHSGTGRMYRKCRASWATALYPQETREKPAS